jgi:uncharacterized protein YndB with AHSA1/START domain
MEVHREIVVDAPLDDVWQALTDADELAEWFANDVELELRPGGRGRFEWNDGEVREARVQEIDPGRRLAFLWRKPDRTESQVCWTLDETVDGTRVTVIESLPSDGPQACAEWGPAVELWAAGALAAV